ncbi:MAG: hypothetical protein HYS69_17265 [candidate division NC10 bacterium]|nr:hypothetical protein [candidate division NC10 bacterium]
MSGAFRERSAVVHGTGRSVRAVSHEGQEVLELPGGDTIPLLDLGWTPGPLLHRVPDDDPLAHDLQQVLVARNQRHPVPLGGGPDGHGPQDVIRLLGRDHEDRDTHGLQDPVDGRNLLGHGLGHRGPLGLVLGELAVAGRRARPVEGHCQGVRLLFAEELQEHAGEPQDRMGGGALGVAQGRQGKESAVQGRAPVHKDQA